MAQLNGNMNKMYAYLNPDLQLRGWEKLEYALVSKSNAWTTFLRAQEYQFLDLCNGEIDLSLPIFPAEFKDYLEEAVRKGIVFKSDTPHPIEPDQRYFKYNNRYISTAHWSITGKCNCNCRHCFMSASKGTLGEFDHETIMDICRQIVDCGIRKVSITGGEPLICDSFWDVVDYFIAHNVKITQIYSNGLLVDQDFIDKLKQRNIAPTINMSFDGVGYHDWLRGLDGAEDAVNNAFLVCKENNIPTASEMCLHKGNVGVLRESINHLAKLGCRSMKVVPVSEIGSWKENNEGTTLSVKELFDIYLDYIPWFYKDGAPLDLQLSGFFMAKKNDTKNYVLPMDRSKQDCEKVCLCNHARNTLYISPQGYTLSCMSMSGSEDRFNYPKIQDIGLAKCLNDSSYMEFISTPAKTVIEHNEKCRDCEYRFACMGGCRASALDTTPNDILGPDEACCEFYKGQWSQKIKEAVERVSVEIKQI